MNTPIEGPSPAAPPPMPPAIPLQPQIRAAYESLSASYQAAFDANADYAFRVEVRNWKTNVDNILEKDAMYVLNANTALLKALLIQISSTNLDLIKIKAEITALAGDFALVGDVLLAINKVLTLVPV